MNFFNKFLLGVWNVGIIELPAEKLLNNASYSIRWMKHSYHDRFFADPFLWKYDREYYYILAEEFPFYSNLGRIVKLKIARSSMVLAAREEVIAEPYHLSYPFVKNQRIIPEGYRSGACFSYDCNGKDKQPVISCGLIDQTFLEHENKEWIFATDANDPLAGLKIFYRNSDEIQWHEHKKSPVKSDICTARPGGHFFRLDGVLYRPAQDSLKRYGHKIHIMRIDKLTCDDFQETEVAEITADASPPYHQGLHTFNAEDGFIVVDGYREYHSFFIKPLCLKMKKWMTKLGENRK